MHFTIPTNKVVVKPASEPVGVEDVKANGYVVDLEEDNRFIEEQLIPTARAFVENLACRSLITQTRAQYYDAMPCSPIRLRYGPVQQISSWAYTDANEASQTLASSFYNLDTSRIPGRLLVAYRQTWPVALEMANSVAITYLAGYGTQPTDVPIIYRRAIIVLCTHWYDNRDQFGCAEDDLTCRLIDMLSIEGRTLEYA